MQQQPVSDRGDDPNALAAECYRLVSALRQNRLNRKLLTQARDHLRLLSGYKAGRSIRPAQPVGGDDGP